MDFETIYQDGTYLANNPDWGRSDAIWKVDIISHLLQSNHIQPSSVTDVGCGSGEVLRFLKRALSGNVLARGYDISSDAINFAQNSEADSLFFFHENFLESNVYSDVLLVIDVLEHVPDFYAFLENIRSRASYFVFHIPLDLSARSILKPHIMLQQRQSVGHIHYFTRETVEWSLDDAGFEIMDWLYTKPLLDTKPGRSLKQIVKKTLRNFSFSINKNLSAKLWGNYSMMILAKQRA